MALSNQVKNQHLLWRAGFGPAVEQLGDLFLPVSGSVTELNPALAGAPELVNTDPYGEGWMEKWK